MAVQRSCALVLGALLLVPVPAWAWSCSAEGLPLVTCEGQSCRAGDEDIQLRAYADAGGTMSVCMGSGCFEGRARSAHKGRHFEVFVGAALVWNGGSGAKEDAVLSIDRQTGFGALMAAGRVTPLKCEP